MEMRQVLIFIIAMSCLSCEERTDIDIPARDIDVLVVEGVMTNERKNHLVKISKPYGNLNGVAEPVTGAAVYIFEDTTNVYGLTEFPQGSGNYYTPLIRGLTGRLYTLYILYEGKGYFAQDSPLPVEPLGALAFTETEKGNVLTLNPQGGDPNYVEHFITWQHTDVCTEQDLCKGRLIYYDLKTIDVNEMFKPEQESFYFPDQSIVVRRKYSLSAAYKTYLRSMLSETEWRGGSFDVQRSNVPGNLSEGATGFFAVCSVVSDTTLIQ